MKKPPRWIILALLSLAPLLLTGCPNPNTYGTPRTVPPGKLAHSIAVEAYTFTVESEDPVTGEEESLSATFPLPPTYTLRIGAMEGFDVGVRVANASSIGADLKLNFVKSEYFDAAIDPGFQWFNMTVGAGDTRESINVIYVHTPFLLGINFDESISMVLTPGAMFGILSTDVISGSDVEMAATQSGVIARIGVGFNFRVSKKFALHPEATLLRTLETDNATISLFGLGFNFGNLPDHETHE